MREIYEFRVREQDAGRLFAADEGRSLGFGVRKILIAPQDSRFLEIGRVCFSSWNVIRRYPRREIEAADLFLFTPLVWFEPAAEECGTIYDDGPACEICLANANAVTPLFLPIARIPKSKDIARTIGGEIVVSARFVEMCQDAGLTGATFPAVRQKGGKDLRGLGWHQLSVQPAFADIVPPTQTGITPFDLDEANEYRCRNGDTIGLNLLSEITIAAETRGEADFLATRQFLGRRAGLLRPQRQFLVSQRVRRLLEANRISGYRLEVVHTS